MRVPVIQLRSRTSNIERRAGTPVEPGDICIKLEGDADVYKPNGEPLCLLRRAGIAQGICEAAYPALHALRVYTSENRGKYTGVQRVGTKFLDGSVSKNTRTRDENGKIVRVRSAIVGYFDRQGGRFPFCRETAFVGREPEKWKTVMPMVDAAAALFQRVLPERYTLQKALAERTPKEFVIGNSPFTTLTVNNNVVGAIHVDKGDYKDGFGVISVVRRGSYQGGWLVFPEYGVAADLQDGDVIFFNSHDWHGVTGFAGTSEDYERISVVYYYRSKMQDCLPIARELERAKMRA